MGEKVFPGAVVLWKLAGFAVFSWRILDQWRSIQRSVSVAVFCVARFVNVFAFVSLV